MTRALVVAALVASLTAFACGGGGSSADNGGSTKGSTEAGTKALAAAFSEEIAKIQECVQGEVDGKGDCTVNFLQDPVTRICSEVRTRVQSAAYPGADITKFDPACDEWTKALGVNAAGKVEILKTMAASVDALK